MEFGKISPARSSVTFLFKVLLFLGMAMRAGLAAESLLGPMEELSMLDDFLTNSGSAWQSTSGGNVAFTLVSGLTIPGVADSVMQLDFKRKNPEEKAATQNWFSMKRSLAPGLMDKQADGVRLVLGAASGGQWWMSVGLQLGTQTFSHVLQPILPARTATEHLIPFEEFADSGRVLTRDQANLVDGITLSMSANGPSLYFDRITTYRRQKYSSWLSFVSTHPTNNIFEPGEKVVATFTPGGTIPATAKGFRYEVQDFFEKVTAADQVRLDGSQSYKLELTPKTHGYYELRAFWLDAAGKDLENRSCILAEGSLPPGLATFAVMPRAATQNLERFKLQGTNAFLGLHGDFMGLADLIGLAWRFEYSRWPDLEPQRPDRSHGVARWAADRIQKEPPRPSYRFHILPFCGNFGGPAWAARNKPGTAPPYADWNEYLAMLRDCVEVEKHFYPHLNPRIYGAAWEVNLNMPPSNFEPPYTVADIVELHRKTRETVKSVDAGAFVIGPCPSNLNPQWFEQVFAGGLLDYVDGIEAHGYTEGAFTPEEYNYPAKLLALRQLMQRYNHGKVLPIFITEAGFRGQIGSKIIHRTQAQLMTRLAIILKGEGVRVFLPFYGIDYDRDGWWGFCFNLEVDAANPWMTKRISPKPIVNAFATCADLLEGAAPVRRVRTFGEDVWGYLFEKQGTNLLAVWSSSGAKRISLSVPAVQGLEVIDLMGHVSQKAVRNGRLELDLDESPKYVVGIPSPAP